MHQRITLSPRSSLRGLLLAALAVTIVPAAQPSSVVAQKRRKPAGKATSSTEDFSQYGIYQRSAPRPKAAAPRETSLPLELQSQQRIGLIGNTLLARSQYFGHLESLLHQRYPNHELVVRNLAWPADTPDLQPRPDNFADTEQHLHHEKIDVIIAAYGFNESFAGPAGLNDFRTALTKDLTSLKTKAFNGKTAPQIVLLSPIANENISQIPAADNNNANIKLYTEAMREIAQQQKIAFVDLLTPTKTAMQSPTTDLTINGVHLNAAGYEQFAKSLYQQLFNSEPPEVNETLRQDILDKNRQYQRRFRPLNTFYYTGGRSKSYGYLDFLPAMRNFEILTSNRDQRIWNIAQGQPVPAVIDDSNLPALPKTKESRGANQWMSAAEELKAFKVDPRFEVNLFAGEEEFPNIAAPIQMRWDSRGRLWVSCSTTYPHVYPGQEPVDKLVILEDTDGDGKADKSSVFADDLQIPLSFEFGDGGVYVSEMPHLTFLKDTNGDGKADLRRIVLSGFGTEDSHHSLHDFVWSPDGDLIFRESIFHHSQVETAYGPVRQQNSGWFRFVPRNQRLTSFGTYHSTNPWGVTFDDWGQHVASHPIYAAAFHSLDPAYPQQHPKPNGLRAYSGTCGQEFVDFNTFPADMQGGYIKARYKPTNRIEIHKWKEQEFGYDEEYVSDLIFSTNLSFIPVDVGFGPRGAFYVCDWYNPIKGHAQYSLRDERRDRHSGRIWRVTPKDKPLQEPAKIADANIPELLELLKRPEYRIRYWAKRELRERDPQQVADALDVWVKQLQPSDSRYRHHQLEAVWLYRGINVARASLLEELLTCDNHYARAAAVEQLRYWHTEMPRALNHLRQAANDSNATVRMQAVIAGSYIGSKAALDGVLDVFKHPRGGHLQYAIQCSLGSKTLKPHWENDPKYDIAKLLKNAGRNNAFKEPSPSASQAEFDQQKDLKLVKIGCLPERMLFTVKQFAVVPGQPVKVVFTNPDATDHNLVIVQPGALADVGMAANEMAKNPKYANSDFIPESQRKKILHASPMIGPTRKSLVSVQRFNAPEKPGIYPYVCTFPGHWVVMNGVMVVADTPAEAKAMLAAAQPKVIKEWTLADFPEVKVPMEEQAAMRGMQAFVKARCNQCHVIAGHGVNLGPDLTESVKKLKGKQLLEQILLPSSKIHEKYQTHQFLLADGRTLSGVIVKDTGKQLEVMTNLLTPTVITRLSKGEIDLQRASKVSAMPKGLVDVLTRKEILDLLSFLEHGYKLPAHLKHSHGHDKEHQHSKE